MKVIRTLKTNKKGTKKMKEKWIIALIIISLSTVMTLFAFIIDIPSGIFSCGFTSVIIGLSVINIIKTKENSYTFEVIFVFVTIILILFFSILILDEIYTREYITQKQMEQQAEQIEAVQEFEANKEISADKAWWINMPIETVKEKCQKMAEVVGKDWQYLVDLLSGKGAIIKLMQIQ